MFNYDVARAFACLWVVAVHINEYLDLPGKINTFFEAGSSGVIIFFVMSGFFSFLELNKQGGKVNVVKWWFKRSMRILPLYYTVIIFYFIWYTYIIKNVPNDSSGLGWLRYLFCLNQIVPSNELFWTNIGAVWTISIFLFFDFIIPFLARYIKTYIHAVILFCVLFLESKLWGNLTEWIRPMEFLYYFSIGIILFFVKEEKKEDSYILFSSIIIAVLVALDSEGGVKFGLLVSVILVSSVALEYPSNVMGKIIAIISEYSFSIYLTHPIMLLMLQTYEVKSKIIFVGCFVCGTGLFSLILHQLIEVNGIRLAYKLQRK